MGDQRQAFPHQVQPDIDLRVLHEAVVRADPEIQRGGDAGAAAHRGAVPGGDGDLVDLVKRPDRPLANSRAAASEAQRSLIGGAGVGQVRPGREVLAGPGEDHHPGIRIIAERQRHVFDFAEMMDAMSMVIGPAAALACERLTKDKLDLLDELISTSESAAAQRDFVKVSQLDFEFHRILAEATGNRHLSRYLLHLHQVATRFNFAAWKRDYNALPSIEEHRQIVQIMRQREVEGAKSAMRAHIENARQRIVGTMKITA